MGRPTLPCFSSTLTPHASSRTSFILVLNVLTLIIKIDIRAALGPTPAEEVSVPNEKTSRRFTSLASGPVARIEQLSFRVDAEDTDSNRQVGQE